MKNKMTLEEAFELYDAIKCKVLKNFAMISEETGASIKNLVDIAEEIGCDYEEVAKDD